MSLTLFISERNKRHKKANKYSYDICNKISKFHITEHTSN